VPGAGHVPILQFGLGDGRPERDVPEGRRLGLVRLAGGEQAEEPALRRPAGPLPDGGVLVAPVDGQPEGAPQRLENPLVLGGEPQAQLDEVRAGDGDLVFRRLRWRL